MEKIIVTAQYEGEREDKITALMEAAQKAKEVANATESRLQPLIDAAGEKKWELILEQFHDFTNRYEAFLEMTGDPEKWGETFSDFDAGCGVSRSRDNKMIVKVRGGTVIDDVVRKGVLPSLCKDDGLVTNWNEFGVIKHFDARLEALIRKYIAEQEQKKTMLERTAKNIMR